MKIRQITCLFIAALGATGCGHHYWTLQEKEAWNFPNNNILSERAADETTLAYREFRDSSEQNIVKGTFREGGTEKVAVIGALGTPKTGISLGAAGLMLLSSAFNDMSIEAQQARKLRQTHAQALIGDVGYYRSFGKSTNWEQASAEFVQSRDALLTLLSQCEIAYIDPKSGYSNAAVRIRKDEFRQYRYKCVDGFNNPVALDIILAKVESDKFAFELEISPVIDYHMKPSEVAIYIDKVDAIIAPKLDSNWTKVRSYSMIRPGDKTPLEQIASDFRFFKLGVQSDLGSSNASF